MRAQLKIEYEDYYELCRVHERIEGRAERRSPVTIAAYLACGLGFLFIVIREPFVMWLAPVSLVATGLIVLLVPQLQDGRKLRQAFDHYAERLHSTELATDDVGLLFTSPARESRVFWNSFSGFEETRRLLVLRSSYEPVIIAKRTFADPSELDAFRVELRARIPRASLGFPVVGPSTGE